MHEDGAQGWEVGDDGYDVLLAAIHRASKIKEDFASPVTGPLAEYLKYAEEKAVSAMHLLVNADPTNAVGIILLQKEIVGYAEVAGWIQDKLGDAEDAQQALLAERDQAEEG